MHDSSPASVAHVGEQSRPKDSEAHSFSIVRRVGKSANCKRQSQQGERIHLHFTADTRAATLTISLRSDRMVFIDIDLAHL